MEKYVEKYKFHYLYKITNLVNNKYYYGIHSTNNIEDGYMGSGVFLRKAYKKYGIENFRKDILGFYENRQKLLQAERDIVNMFEIKNSMCYNIAVGGRGQFYFPSQNEIDEKNKKAWLTRKQNENWKEQFLGYNNPEFIGRCKQKYENDKELIVKWLTKTNLPDSVVEKLFNKKAHQGMVVKYYIDAGILPKPIKVDNIRYESGYKRKTFFSEDELLNVYFITGSDTSKHIYKLPEIIKFIKDETCTNSKVQNSKKYNFTESDIMFFKNIGAIKQIGEVMVPTGCKNMPFGKKTLFEYNSSNVNIIMIDLEMNKYEYDDYGCLIQKGRFFL